MQTQATHGSNKFGQPHNNNDFIIEEIDRFVGAKNSFVIAQKAKLVQQSKIHGGQTPSNNSLIRTTPGNGPALNNKQNLQQRAQIVDQLTSQSLDAHGNGMMDIQHQQNNYQGISPNPAASGKFTAHQLSSKDQETNFRNLAQCLETNEMGSHSLRQDQLKQQQTQVIYFNQGKMAQKQWQVIQQPKRQSNQYGQQSSQNNRQVSQQAPNIYNTSQSAGGHASSMALTDPHNSPSLPLSQQNSQGRAQFKYIVKTPFEQQMMREGQMISGNQLFSQQLSAQKVVDTSAGRANEETANNQILRISHKNSEGHPTQQQSLRADGQSFTQAQMASFAGQAPPGVVMIGSTAPGLGHIVQSLPQPTRNQYKNGPANTHQLINENKQHFKKHDISVMSTEQVSGSAIKVANFKTSQLQNINGPPSKQSPLKQQHQSRGTAQQKQGVGAYTTFFYDEAQNAVQNGGQRPGHGVQVLRASTGWQVQQIPSASLQMIQQQAGANQVVLTSPPFFSQANSHHNKLKNKMESQIFVHQPGPISQNELIHQPPNSADQIVAMPMIQNNDKNGLCISVATRVQAQTDQLNKMTMVQMPQQVVQQTNQMASQLQSSHHSSIEDNLVQFKGLKTPGFGTISGQTMSMQNQLPLDHQADGSAGMVRIRQPQSDYHSSPKGTGLIADALAGSSLQYAPQSDMKMQERRNLQETRLVSKTFSQQFECVKTESKDSKNCDAILIATSSANTTPMSDSITRTKAFQNISPNNEKISSKERPELRIIEQTPQKILDAMGTVESSIAVTPSRQRAQESRSIGRSATMKRGTNEAIDAEHTNEDELARIQDDEAEVGPIDDEEEDMGTSPECQDLLPQNQKASELQLNHDNADLGFQKNLLDGGYDFGDEPEEDDSQVDMDEDQQYFDCMEDDDELENDDILEMEDGEEENDKTMKNENQTQVNPSQLNEKQKESEQDANSKVSTAYTNVGQQTHIKVEQSPNTDVKIKRKSTKSKRLTKGKNKGLGEGHDETECLDDEQKEQRRIDLNIIDNQLDQLVIKKPATLLNQTGKDRSLKDAFLRRPPNNVITLSHGPIPGRPPTIFFNYPPFLRKQRPYIPSKILQMTQDEMKPYSTLTFKINNSTHTYNCVVNAFKIAGFRICEGGAWNCLWTGLIRPSKLKYMNQFQKINHFAGAWNIGHKGNLWRNVQRQRRRHGREFEICPPTYLFPEDYKRWNQEREATNFRDMYIMKPTGSSCGRGIRVIGRKQTIGKRHGYLVQKYLAKPHLLRGYKYDMRIYIVVTSFEPLKAYQFSQGLVRLATQPYSTAKGSLKKRFIHLTNFSINKKAENYRKNATGLQVQGDDGQRVQAGAESSSTAQDTEEGDMSSKWSLDQLRQEYEKMGIDYDQVFSQIKTLCVKALMAVEPQITTAMRTAKYRNQSFEIYGFDVIIDQKLRPWLLEVNVAPSLSSSSPYDKQVKTMLLCDTLHLVGFQPFDRKKLEDDKKKETRHRLLGFEPSKHAGRSHHKNDDAADSSLTPSLQIQQKTLHLLTPVRQQSLQQDNQGSSPDKIEKNASKPSGTKDKIVIPSFLEGFQNLTEDDMEILADYEEEQSRKGHFETIFPTRERIEQLGGYFESQRHANSLLWQYIRQKQPIQHVRSYFKAHPCI